MTAKAAEIILMLEFVLLKFVALHSKLICWCVIYNTVYDQWVSDHAQNQDNRFFQITRGVLHKSRIVISVVTLLLDLVYKTHPGQFFEMDITPAANLSPTEQQLIMEILCIKGRHKVCKCTNTSTVINIEPYKFTSSPERINKLYRTLHY